MRGLYLNRHTRNILRKPMLWIAIVAALLYCSWPLGYLLNPTVAHHAMASQLEAGGQPYNWVFIGLDILSGVALLIAGGLQWFKSKGLLIRLSILGYMVFAILVILAAVVPFNCSTIANTCNSLAHSPLLVIHGLASIVSVIFLLVSMVLVYKSLIGKQHQSKLRAAMLSVFVAWGLLGLSALFIGRHHRADENIVQYVLISLCSLSLLFSVSAIEYLRKPFKHY